MDSENIKKDRKSKVYIEEVDRYILELLLGGMTPMQMIDKLMTEYDFKTVANCRRRIATVVNQMVIEGKEEKEQKIEKYKSQFYNLYKKSMEASEYKTANAILQNLVKLEGLDVNKIETKIEGEFEIKFE
jgi:hypothetical protein